jgi:hypothetical protein
MSVYARIQRMVVRTLAVIAGTAVVALGILVLTRLIAHTTPAEAASVIYYPNFCLGGWKYPQHASGPAAVTGTFDPDKFNTQNSSYLESSVASQLFCGYFSVKNAKNPPTKAVISFNWLFAFKDGSAAKDPEDSFTSTSTDSVGISPATGFTPATTTATTTQLQQNPQNNSQTNPPSSNPPASNPQSNAAPTNPNTAAVGDTNTSSGSSGSSTTTEIPAIHDPNAPTAPASNTSTPDSTGGNSSTPASDSGTTPPPASSSGATPPSDATPPSPTPAPAPEPTPAPAPAPAPEAAPAAAPAPSGDAPQTLNSKQSISSFIASLIAEKVHAEEVDTVVQSPLTGNSFKDFLEVSYSLDGIRWTAIGRVNKSNWKNYSVAIPVNSWDEVKRLQIMVSVLPTIDEKPDIYLDSMSMRAEYSQTVAELAAQGFNAVTNAVDSLIGDDNGPENAFDIIADAPKGPQQVEIRTKKLQFSSPSRTISVMHDKFDDEGRVIGKVPSKKINISSAEQSATMNVSGSCDKKYVVILTYRNENDYIRKPHASVVNRAVECVGKTFTFDFSALSPETRDGPQYLVVAEQGESGMWDVVSDVFPINIAATTTVQTVYQ